MAYIISYIFQFEERNYLWSILNHSAWLYAIESEHPVDGIKRIFNQISSKLKHISTEIDTMNVWSKNGMRNSIGCVIHQKESHHVFKGQFIGHIASIRIDQCKTMCDLRNRWMPSTTHSSVFYKPYIQSATVSSLITVR